MTEPAVGLGCILEQHKDEKKNTFREHLAVLFHRNTEATPKGWRKGTTIVFSCFSKGQSLLLEDMTFQEIYNWI